MKLSHKSPILIFVTFCICCEWHTSTAFIWKEKGQETDCAVTCGNQTAVSAPATGNTTLYQPYVCAVAGSTFDTFSTGTQIGTLIFVSNILSCWVYSGNPGGPSSTSHSSWSCLCSQPGDQISNATGSTAESCSTTCSREQSFNESLSACSQPSLQPACFFSQEYTFGYQNSSSAATDHSCLAVSPPSTNTPQNPAAVRAQTFQCLCSTAASLAAASLAPNCTTSSFTTSSVVNGSSPSPSPSSSPHSSAGKIAGSIIGGVAGAALIGIVVFLVIRSRRRASEVRVSSAHKPSNAFASPDVQTSMGQKSSLGASSELLAFDLAVASYKRDLSDTSTPLGTSKNLSEMTKSSDISGPLDITSVNFADVQDKFGTVAANLPEPDRPTSGKAAMSHGISSISLVQSKQSDEGSDESHLENTWKIRPQDLQCRMANGVPVTLGEGGYGKVYLGVLHREEVAIKVAVSHNEVQLNRFLREIKTLRACTNPNIVQFIGACVRAKHTFMVMQYMAGGDLLTRLMEDKTGDFGWFRKGKHIALDIVKGLIYLHSRDIAHLDVKSPNVMLAADGRAKLGDVGLGKLVASARAVATDQGSFLWASPEQLTGTPCGTGSDIFAFGTVLWEICTHELPNNRALRAIAVPNEAPPAVASLIDLCHATAIEDRPSAIRVHDLLIEAMM